MEHLMLPTDQYLDGVFSIPFLAQDPYSPPLETYPSRHGWRIDPSSLLPDTHTASGQSTAPRSVASLVQSWLYLGILSEFLGYPVDRAQLQRENNLYTGKVNAMVSNCVNALLRNLRSNGEDEAIAHRDTFYRHFDFVRYRVKELMAKFASNDEGVSLSCLAIASLAEFLSMAVSTVSAHGRLEILRHPVGKDWRQLWYNGGVDCGQSLLEAMAGRGWCRRDLNYLSYSEEAKPISGLWYLANLKPPRTDVVHTACTPDVCNALMIDENRYRQRHSTPGCQCTNVGPGSGNVEAIVRSGKLPLVAWREGALDVREAAQDTPFVAISHIWADGKGNPAANTLPRCVLERIQQLVNRIPCGDADKCHEGFLYFWIDTLCVPREPKDLRSVALARLRQPYQEAAHCLILDSYLEEHAAPKGSPWEILARISVCTWSQRLWTFQEGHLPSRSAQIWFSFRDRLVDLWAEIQAAFFAKAADTGLRENMNLHFVSTHKQTRAVGRIQIPQFDKSHKDDMLPGDAFRRPMVLRSSLKARSTSKAEDEGICLATIMCLPEEEIVTIVRSSGDKRMARVWASMSQLPGVIVCSKAPTKLNVKGYRWAPSTFMGDLSMDIVSWGAAFLPWESQGTIDRDGFRLRRPALKLGNPAGPSGRDFEQLCTFEGHFEVYACDQHQSWYVCRFEEAWHDKPAVIKAGNEYVIVLVSGLASGTDDFDSREDIRGLLASIQGESSDDSGMISSNLVVAHRHIMCQKVSKRLSECYSILKNLTVQVSAQVGKSRDDLEFAIVQSLQDNEEAVRLMGEIRKRKGDRGAGLIGFEACARFMRQVLRNGLDLTAERTGEDAVWVID